MAVRAITLFMWVFWVPNPIQSIPPSSDRITSRGHLIFRQQEKQEKKERAAVQSAPIYCLIATDTKLSPKVRGPEEFLSQLIWHQQDNHIIVQLTINLSA